jgi:hypothetical protein
MDTQHGCALLDHVRLWCGGDNTQTQHQLGQGPTAPSESPEPVAPMGS